MFPGVNGFHWTFGHVLFLSVFFTVLTVVALTAFNAFWRAGRSLRKGRTAAIRWRSEFEELSSRERRCRHELTGVTHDRECPNGFDCRRCTEHPKFLTGSEPAPRYYHRGHTWVEVDHGGVCTVGLDEIASRLLHEAEAVDLPAPGAKVENNGPGWRMRKAGSEVRVLAPVDGEVVETGGLDKGWFLKIKPREGEPDLRHLLRGAEVRAWMAGEMDRLQLMLSPSTMADGGELVDDPVRAQPEADWDRVFGAMLLEP